MIGLELDRRASSAHTALTVRTWSVGVAAPCQSSALLSINHPAGETEGVGTGACMLRNAKLSPSILIAAPRSVVTRQPFIDCLIPRHGRASLIAALTSWPVVHQLPVAIRPNCLMPTDRQAALIDVSRRNRVVGRSLIA